MLYYCENENDCDGNMNLRHSCRQAFSGYLEGEHDRTNN